MNTVEILQNARKLIENPENWIQGDFAQTAEGLTVHTFDDRATCFCSLGALRRVTGDTHRTVFGEGYAEAKQILAEAVPFRTVHGRVKNLYRPDIDEYNDTHTHEEVLAVFDAAIAAAQLVTSVEKS